MVPELFYKNVSESLYIENMGKVLAVVPWCVINFGHFTTLIYQCYFKYKTCLAKCDHRNLMCEESSCTITWCEEKTHLNHAWRFLRTNKIPLQKYPLGVQWIEFVCCVCFAVSIRCCCKND